LGVVVVGETVILTWIREKSILSWLDSGCSE